MMRCLQVRISAADPRAPKTDPAQILAQIEGLEEYSFPVSTEIKLRYDLRKTNFRQIRLRCADAGLRLGYPYCDRFRYRWRRLIEQNLQEQLSNVPSWAGYLHSAYIRCQPPQHADRRSPQWKRHLKRGNAK